MNTAPSKTIGQTRKYKNIKENRAQNCKNIVQHCKWHDSLNTLSIETILYVLQPHKQDKHNSVNTQQEVKYLQLQLYTSFTTIQIKPVKI